MEARMVRCGNLACHLTHLQRWFLHTAEATIRIEKCPTCGWEQTTTFKHSTNTDSSDLSHKS